MKSSRATALTFAVAAVCAAGLGLFIYVDHPQPPKHLARAMPTPNISKTAKAATEDRAKLDNIFNTRPKEAEKGYRQFIAENDKSKDPHVQDEVGIARFRVGYLAAARKDYGSARAVFLEASAKYKGTDATRGDFG